MNISLQVILAVSKDGYLAREQNDAMAWTGRTDKAIFQLLTMNGGPLGIPQATLNLMPANLKGRKVVPLSSKKFTLEEFAETHPTGWLVAGPTLVTSAILSGLVRQVFIVRLDRFALPEPGHGLLDTITGLVTGSAAYDAGWNLVNKITFAEAIVEVYRNGP